jgi:ATP-dependent helicase/nuclease subunit A
MATPTQQQQQAIDARGSVLLAAGAGTGKTATLVRRCLRLILEDDIDVDRLLVVTFTNAAAAEMKQRLRESLRTAASDTPDQPRIARQLLLLDAAHISTLHAFCLDLIRAHFAELHLDPAVTVLDDSIALPLAHTTLRQVVTQSIAADPDTRALADGYCGGSGERLTELILQTHRFYVAQPHADALRQRHLDFFEAESPLAWRSFRDDILRSWAASAATLAPSLIPLALDALTQVKGYGGSSATGKSIQHLESILNQLSSSLARNPSSNSPNDHIEVLHQVAATADKSLWPRGSKPARQCLAPLLDVTLSLRSWLPTPEGDPLDAEWALCRRPLRQLLDLTHRFALAYTDAKRSQGGLDFADLEQLALQLLISPQGLPTPVALTWRARFEQVFVDECQDINAAQDTLLRALARNGDQANLFMVGDVKQSIYRFRMAAPERFREHATHWRSLPHHQVLHLTENFRSRAGLIAFTNHLFTALFAPRLGEVGYDPEDRLAFALPQLRAPLSLQPPTDPSPSGTWPDPTCRVELHFVTPPPESDTDPDTDPDVGPVPSEPSPASVEPLESTDPNDWDDLLDVERQAHVAANRLRDLYDGAHQIWDTRSSSFRSLQWSDVGLLLRSVSGRTEPFLREFAKRQIPLAVEQGDFLDTLEASDLRSLLRLLDNPRQDIPLFAVLRSPLVGWALDDLVPIRPTSQTRRQPSLAWTHLETTAHTTSAVGLRCRDFLNRFSRWRRLARMTSLSCVLETVLADTQYEAFLLTLPDGPDRVAHVRRFLDLARRYDPLQRQGLYRFLRFLDEQQTAQREIEPLPPRESDAVQLRSIHKSKGLEFPVVIVAGLGARFHNPDLRQPILLSRQWGPAPQVVDPVRARRYAGLLHHSTQQEEKRAALAEELRLLYVAITRARDTLLLVGSLNPTGKTLRQRLQLPFPLALTEAKSFAEWIVLALDLPLDDPARQGSIPLPADPLPAHLRWYFHSDAPTPPTPDSPAIPTSLPKDLHPAPTEAAPSPTEMSAWPHPDSYPYAPATWLPAKTSASALRHAAETTQETTPAPWLVDPSFHPARPTARQRLTAAAIGTAHHRFLQHLDLTHTTTLAELQDQSELQVSRQWLTPDEQQSLDLPSLLAFWNSPLGSALRQHPHHVHRELPFTAAFTPRELPELTPQPHTTALPADDFIVVQGTVDLALILPDALWIVDFKTDRVPPDALPDRIAGHTPQLRLYATALQRIYQRPVTQVWLYFIHPQHFAPLPPPPS